MALTVFDKTQTPAIIPSSGAANILINGGMEVWQRGTSFSPVVTKTYTADRWFNAGGGTPPTGTISKETSLIDSGTSSLKISSPPMPEMSHGFLTQLKSKIIRTISKPQKH